MPARDGPGTSAHRHQNTPSPERRTQYRHAAGPGVAAAAPPQHPPPMPPPLIKACPADLIVSLLPLSVSSCILNSAAPSKKKTHQPSLPLFLLPLQKAIPQRNMHNLRNLSPPSFASDLLPCTMFRLNTLATSSACATLLAASAGGRMRLDSKFERAVERAEVRRRVSSRKARVMERRRWR